MKISNNILVGVEYPRFCEYYSDVREYANELNAQYPDSVDHELIGLSVYILTEETQILRVDYYTIADGKIKQYTYYTNKEGNDVEWTISEDLNKSLEIIEKEIKYQPNVFDLDFFIKNN